MRRILITTLPLFLVPVWVSTPAVGRSRRAAARAPARPAAARTAPPGRAAGAPSTESRASPAPARTVARSRTAKPKPMILQAEPEVITRATAMKKKAKRMMHAGIGLSITGLVLTAAGATLVGVGHAKKGMVIGGTVNLAVGTASAVVGVVVWAVGAKRYQRAERLVFDSMTRKVTQLEPVRRREPPPGSPPPVQTVLAWKLRF